MPWNGPGSAPRAGPPVQPEPWDWTKMLPGNVPPDAALPENPLGFRRPPLFPGNEVPEPRSYGTPPPGNLPPDGPRMSEWTPRPGNMADGYAMQRGPMPGNVYPSNASSYPSRGYNGSFPRFPPENTPVSWSPDAGDAAAQQSQLAVPHADVVVVAAGTGIPPTGADAPAVWDAMALLPDGAAAADAAAHARAAADGTASVHDAWVQLVAGTADAWAGAAHLPA